MTRTDETMTNATAQRARVDGEICGFHVLRRVHTGERTHGFLARAAQGDHVVLRTFSGAEGPARAHAELQLGAQVPSPHLQRARDAGVSPSGDPVLICERLGNRLSQQLEGGGHIAAGSVVTLAAPLVNALRDLHAKDIAHGAVDVAHVRFGADGRPVLVGADGGMPATPSSIRSDLEGLAHLITATLGHSDEGSRGRGASDITGWLQNQLSRESKPAADLYADLECRIFALAEPLPFAVGREPEPVRQRGADARRASSLRERAQDSTLTRLLEGELSFSLPILIAPVKRLFTAVASTTRRRNLILVVALVFVATVAGALWLIPQPSSAEEPHETTAETTVEPVPAVSPSLAPAQALTALLAGRSSCLAGNAPSACLASVYEPTSPALSADKSAARSGKPDPFPVLSLDESQRTLATQQDRGGAVVVVVRSSDSPGAKQPVSVLLVKTETGWLIRDVFDF
ncbi:hypothetical protein [Paramicrobacterium fandaimingii]|uniref:hypothetical protein n=1 Tax=Paramicrobacterium fandaimingii TaxID=2708079 RepID=UPI0014242662|nr:hypothetical protein [Microbacterium fandaimingii]